MSATLHELGPMFALILVGFLPNEVWRLVGLMLVHGLDEKSQVIVWVRAVATAMLAGVLAQLILSTSGPLASIPVSVRIGAAMLGFVAFLIAKRSVFAGVLTAKLRSCWGRIGSERNFSPSAPPPISRPGRTAHQAFPSRSRAASWGRRPCAG